MGRLSVKKVEAIKEPGRYRDGGNLALVVGPTGRKWWSFLYMLNGRCREMGMGSIELMSLADARDEALEHRRLLRQGIDPIEARKTKRATTNGATFQECAEEYVASNEAGWRNAKHAAQWRSTLKSYVYPHIGNRPVASVELADVLAVLKPIWTSKAETANRIRGRMERVLDFAKVSGNRSGENPARWKGNLDHILPPQSKVSEVKHHAALPFKDVPAFIDELRERQAPAARALEFLILTATRTGELISGQWSEVDFDEALWTIPSSRMKAGKEHRIPLSPRALAILRERRNQAADNERYIFTSAPGRKLSSMAFLQLVKRMGRTDITPHGFRSSFRDWCAERTNYASEIAEMALAHAIGNKVEASYRRGDLLEKRRRLMDDWSRFCAGETSGKVLRFRERG